MFRAESLGKRCLLPAAAVFAFGWSVFRAAYQSITLDEADSYLWFGGGQGATFIWYAFPNNHVLNSLLIWISTHLFGLSALAVRLPALAGAAMYIGVAYFLCRALTDRFVLQLAAFLCLVYNPFVLDFFAAARGYTLADAFLLAALAVPVWQARTGRVSVAVAAALASAAVGLSFVSNFSFAFIDAAALAAVAVWALVCRRESASRILACCTLPALAVALGLCGYPIFHYPRHNLWFGAHSLGEMTHSLVTATLYRAWEPLRRQPWMQTADALLLPTLGAACAARVVAGGFDPAFRRDMRPLLAAALGAILLLTLAAHLMAFRVAGLPLPMSRTAIYFLPLVTWIAALLAAAQGKQPAARSIGRAVTVLLLCLAAHHLLSLRYSYFKEYDQQAEIRQVYRILTLFQRQYGLREFTTDGTYASPLEFYRTADRNSDFPRVDNFADAPAPGKAVYVLHGEVYRAFLNAHGLTAVYRGPVSRVVVAVPRGGRIPLDPVAP